jgi:tetratricopeptide (TPR) repeat protein
MTPRLFTLALALSALSAQAQLIDDVEYRREGADAVLQIRLITEIQYQRAAIGRSGDLTQAFYLLLPTRQTLSLITSERRLAARGAAGDAAGLPGIVVTDESSSGRAANERRVLIRLDRAVPHQVRAGRGGRTIEVVLPGMGDAVGLAPVAPPVVVAPSQTAPAPAVPGPATADNTAAAAALLQAAQEALGRQDTNAAIDTLSRLLDLPPNPSARTAQALIGQARQQAGDAARARSEYELFLRLYPEGADADRVRSALAALAAPATSAARVRQVTPTTTLSGSVSSFYYGGQSKVRTREFQDSVLSGLPELVTDATLAASDQKQLVTGADVNWRHRDAEVDQRFVFRDTYTRDGLRPEKSINKLSALYFEQRSFSSGTSFRVGRQSPLGGGVLGRFDGAQASYAFQPKWKASVVAGVPTDTLLESKRHFYGGSVEADALLPGLGGSVYGIQQVVDGVVDRRAVGSELRYFDGGLSATGQLDYDLVLKGLNIVSVQSTWQRADGSVLNVLYDRRTTPMLMLGNALFFSDPNLTVRPTRLADLLAGKSVQALRDQVSATTAMATQASVGLTTPITPRWQVGADVRYTNVGAIAPVADILPNGLPSTGDLWSLGLQAIGTNLYSQRDTHVVIANILTGPTFKGQLLSYNNSSQITPTWLLEPSLKLYHQTDNTGVATTRWSPGLRLSWRVHQQVTLETELSTENSRTTGPNRHENSSRIFYYLGGRADF